MTKITLKSKKREEVGKKLEKFRLAGLIPAVMYGHGTAPQALWINAMEFGKVFAKAGESTVLELEIGEQEKANVLVHDIQVDPRSGKFSHLDFFKVRMDEKLETEIALEFVGESPAVKSLGGILVKNMDEVPVSCLPADLPAKIEVDLSLIKTFDDHFKVKDLQVSAKVKIMADEEAVIALVTPPRSEEEIAKLSDKVEEDVTKVEGVVKETPPAAEGAEEKKEKKEEK